MGLMQQFLSRKRIENIYYKFLLTSDRLISIHNRAFAPSVIIFFFSLPLLFQQLIPDWSFFPSFVHSPVSSFRSSLPCPRQALSGTSCASAERQNNNKVLRHSSVKRDVLASPHLPPLSPTHLYRYFSQLPVHAHLPPSAQKENPETLPLPCRR